MECTYSCEQKDVGSDFRVGGGFKDERGEIWKNTHRKGHNYNDFMSIQYKFTN